MNKLRAALILSLALGLCASPAVSQSPAQQGKASQQPPVTIAAANHEAPGLTPPPAVAPAATRPATPVQHNPESAKRQPDSEPKHPTRGDWMRCLQNDPCHPRNLYADKWDRLFRGPIDPFIN